MIAGFKLTVIVPVYNEEKTVKGVVEALCLGDKIDEIIAINDGSTDGSLGQLSSCSRKKLRIISFRKNRGKGAAMAAGVKQAKGDIVIFCDSDLINLNATEVEALAKPLTTHRAKVVLGGFKNKSQLFSNLTGERAYFRNDLLPHLAHIEASRLGVETYLNSVFDQWKVVNMNVIHLEKYEKMALSEASWQYIKEGVEIAMEKAKIKGILSDDIREQLESLKSVRDWVSWEKALKKINNYQIVKMLKKYAREYVGKFQKILGVD